MIYKKKLNFYCLHETYVMTEPFFYTSSWTSKLVTKDLMIDCVQQQQKIVKLGTFSNQVGIQKEKKIWINSVGKHANC